MINVNYRVTVRIGFQQFHADFENESAALYCFNSITVQPHDVGIEDDMLTLSSDSHLDDVTIRRIGVPTQIGNPNRQ